MPLHGPIIVIGQSQLSIYCPFQKNYKNIPIHIWYLGLHPYLSHPLSLIYISQASIINLKVKDN